MQRFPGTSKTRIFSDLIEEWKNREDLESSHQVRQIQRFAWNKEPFVRTAAN